MEFPKNFSPGNHQGVWLLLHTWNIDEAQVVPVGMLSGYADFLKLWGGLHYQYGLIFVLSGS